jgi:hypothetical protein
MTTSRHFGATEMDGGDRVKLQEILSKTLEY